MAAILDSRFFSNRLPAWMPALGLLLAAGAAAAQSFTTPVVSNLTVRMAGRADVKPDPVTVNGSARIRTTVVPDLDWRATPTVLVTIEFVRLTAVGMKGGGRYTVEQTVQRLRTLAAEDTLEVTFPIVPEASAATELRTAVTGLATFALKFDTRSGTLTGAEAKVGTLAD
ncbi:hypothetical protein [Azohydromonas aeria]|uniref:hypothetical protein n=1 Tax=Azohydromonas aeria TaxID=2590212 RepID=UPI0012FB18E5|nr:hypothetical protein [Azohydromonas aeria]